MKKVVVGMSGGVDSSVAAYLLKKQGYDVIGVTMQIWQDEDVCGMEESGGCCGLSAVEDARRVASSLGIPYYVMNFKSEFKEKVIDYFVSEYLKARTPNPCIACNRFVKWEALLNRSLGIGASYVATGHYARITRLDNKRFTIRKSVTSAKDQTYALYNLTQHQLSHTLMPVGEYTKEEIRAIAEELELPVAHKPDSQEICFVKDNNYARFISDYMKDEKNREILGNKFAGSEIVGNEIVGSEIVGSEIVGNEIVASEIVGSEIVGSEIVGNENTVSANWGIPGLQPGNFVTVSGDVLGRHKGLAYYTVGQRKGLNLAMGQPVFVMELRPKTNEVVIGGSKDVFFSSLYANRLNFMAIKELEGEMAVEAKIRYSHKAAPCTIRKTAADEVLCIFDEPQRAVTPGQAVVFYKDDYVVGGGTIVKGSA